MDKNAKERKYELVVIVDAKNSQEEKDQIVKGISDTVSKGGAKVINSQVWLDKQKLAFEIKKKTEGTYYLFNIEGVPGAISKIKSDLRLNDKCLRHLIIQQELNQPLEALKG